MRPDDRDSEQLLAEAYAGTRGCPAPETFLDAAWNDLARAERDAIEKHVERCPACAAERELARVFDAEPGSGGVSSNDVAWVVSRVQSRPLEDKRRWPASWGLAAAAVVVLGLALGLIALRRDAPALPEPGSSAPVFRSSAIQQTEPGGTVAEVPPSLRWSPVEHATEYRVRLTAVDDVVLWETHVSGPEAVLPDELRGRLHRAVLYRWSVDALEKNGAILARSGPIEFMVALESDQR